MILHHIYQVDRVQLAIGAQLCQLLYQLLADRDIRHKTALHPFSLHLFLCREPERTVISQLL